MGGGGGGGAGAGGAGAGFAALTAIFGAGRAVREAVALAVRDGLADRDGRLAAWVRFFSGLRVEEVRAFTARRNFAMPGG